jgi:flagellar assembly protein FliH
VVLFEYPAGPDAPPMPAWGGWAESEDASTEVSSNELKGGTSPVQLHADFERRLAEETRRAFEAGREKGRQEERERLAAAQVESERGRLRQSAQLIASFEEAQERYLHAVEEEVVRLALAVSARILRREAQMDPLLLTGAVRVALGQLSASTQVRLRVPLGELELWTEAIALLPKRALKLTVEAGEGMRLGDCMIETELGSVDLGIRAQLGEIERGFFDRAGSPGTKAAGRVDAESRAESRA